MFSEYLDRLDRKTKYEEENIKDLNEPIIIPSYESDKYQYNLDTEFVKGYNAKNFCWISVLDRLPDGYYPYLVVDKDGDYGVGYYRKEVGAWDSPNFGWLETKDKVDNHDAYTEPCRLGKIVFWMPVPEIKISKSLLSIMDSLKFLDKMANLTPEERKMSNEHLKEISKPTGVNFFDFLDKDTKTLLEPSFIEEMKDKLLHEAIKETDEKILNSLNKEE